MFPHLYVFNYEIKSYNLFNVLGMFLLVILGVRWNYKRGRKYPINIGGLFVVAPSVFILGRLAFYLLFSCSITNIYFFNLQQGGYMFLGSILGGILGGVVYFEIKKVPRIEGIEIFIPYIPIGGILGRFGCFCAGCCYGQITDSVFGICFPEGSHVWVRHVRERLISPDQFFSLPVHPTQLYEIGMWIVAGIILITIRNRRPRKGTIILTFLALYFLMRFVEDFVRADYNKILWNLDLMQVLALFIIPLSLLGILLIYHDKLLPLSLRKNDNTTNVSIENK